MVSEYRSIVAYVEGLAGMRHLVEWSKFSQDFYDTWPTYMTRLHIK